MGNRRRGGVGFLHIDGVQYSVAPDVSYSLGRPVREEVMSSSGVDGYTEKPSPPYIEGNLIDCEDLDLEAFSNLVDAQVTYEHANGKLIAFYHATSMNPDGVKGNAEDGKVPFKFVGQSAQEI